jgi:hypothetical protein
MQRIASAGLALLLSLSSCENGFSQEFQSSASALGIAVMNGLDSYLGSGCSSADIDGDGKDDITFLSKTEGIRSFIQAETGFTELSLPDVPGDIKQASWVDFDNDGDNDLFITGMFGSSAFFVNTGAINLVQVTTNAGFNFAPNQALFGHSWGDYDRDGWLDVYVCSYHQNTFENHLFHNNQDGTFADVTSAAGAGGGFRTSFQSSWIDVNHDLWPDLYIINDRWDGNVYLENNGDGTFTDKSLETGLGVLMDSMSSSFSDFDRDGDFDVYITNGPQGNALLVAHENTFTDEAISRGVAINTHGWGGLWIDTRNVGMQDLHVATSYHIDDHEKLLVLQEDGTFVNVSNSGATESNLKAYSNTKGDFNHDGYYDILLTTLMNTSYRIYMNEGGAMNSLQIQLEGTASNKQGIGSYVTCYSGGQPQHFYTACGGNYLAQESNKLIIGTGTHTQADSVIVTWTSGWTDRWYNLPCNALHQLQEGSTAVAVIIPSSTGPLCPGETIFLSIGNWQTVTWSDGSEENTLEVTEAGMYSAEVTNQWGFTDSASITITEGLMPLLETDFGHPLCAASSDGWIDAITDAPSISITGGEFSGLGPGIYTVTATSSDGCDLHETIMLIAPDSIIAVHDTSWVCFSQTAQAELALSGGTGMLNMEWNGADPVNLPAGTFPFAITDEAGCVTSGEYVVMEYDELTVSSEVTQAMNGENGMIQLNVSGGLPPYEVLWNTGDTGEILIQAGQGTYNAVITDAFGCTANTEVSVIDLHAEDPVSFDWIRTSDGWQLSGDVIQYYQIADASGRLVAQHHAAVKTIPVSELSPGYYILRAATEHGVNTLAFTTNH